MASRHVKPHSLGFNDAGSQLKNSASAKKSLMHKASANDAVRAEHLDAKLQGLGAELEAAAHRKLTHAPLALAGLPNDSTKVMKKRAPIEPTQASRPVPVGPARAPLCLRAHT